MAYKKLPPTANLAFLLFLILALYTSTQAENLFLKLLYQKNGAATGDLFGFSVAGAGDVDGDGKADFIVGAPTADVGPLSDAGSVYVYSGATGDTLYRKNGTAANDQFGNSVAGAGDVNGDGKADFIIGAWQKNSGGLVAAGAAYIYSGSNGLLLFPVKRGADSLNFFGISVAGAGDVDNDARADFIIGAYFADSGTTPYAGTAYVYSGATGAPLLYQKYGADTMEFFGVSVAGAGDVDGDGRPDFIVGATGGGSGSILDAGAAFVYSGATGALLYQSYGDTSGDDFGRSVAGAGDVNNDGKADVIIGAPQADPNGLDAAGSAFIYSGATGALLYRKDGGATGDNFGFSVAAAGDVDGDGSSDFVIGAWEADTFGRTGAGAAYIYSGATGILLAQIYGTNPFDHLGYSVNGAGDVNGDGKADFILGAYGTDPGGFTNAGSAYVYGLVSTDLPRDKENRPARFELSQNYPNPFNPTTMIRYYLTRREQVTLEVFNLVGQRVKVLAEGEQSAGEHRLTWNGRDEKENLLPSGIYFYRLKGEDFSETKKMIFLK